MKNPWKAFQPYDESSSANFKGREENIKELLSIVFQNKTTVCYAESGIGKSSLINAGLKPIFRQKSLFPIDILFTEEKLSTPDFDFDRFIIIRLKEALANQNKFNVGIKFELERTINFESEDLKRVDSILSETSLWWVLHTCCIACHAFGIRAMDFSPIFIFDQFEEIFSSNVDEHFVGDFFRTYLDTAASCMPSKVEDLLHEISQDELELPDTPQYKFLFSLRQDAMGTLDYWITQRLAVPDLRKNHYCLTPLTREQARRVVKDQGVDTLDLVADEIIDEIIEKNADAVPSILLSVFCSRLFDKAVVLTDGTKEQVRKEDVSANRKTLIREFYEYLLRQSGIKEKHVRIIEDCLVSKSTGKRKRIESEHPRLENIGFNQQYKSKLLNCYLISHTVIEGTEYIEIAHDKVAEAISARQKERKLKRNLNNWRFLLFLLPVFLIIVSFAYLIIPRSEAVQDEDFYCLMDYRIQEDGYVDIGSHSPSQFSIRNMIIRNTYKTLSNDYVEKVIIESEESDSVLHLSFVDCNCLREVRLANSITQLPSSSFVNCSNLKVYLHKDIIKIQEDAIVSDNLDFEIDPHNKIFLWQDGILWNTSDSLTPIVYVREDLLREQSSVPFICMYADKDTLSYRGHKIGNFKNEDLRIVTDGSTLLPSASYRYAETIDLSEFEDITAIAADAFRDCRRLKEIILPPRLIAIGDRAFAECERIKTIVLPETLDTIGHYAFANCTELDSISFPTISMDYIGDYALANCSKLKNLRLPSDYILHLGDKAFIDCSSLEQVALPARVDFLYYTCFNRCKSLNSFFTQNEQHKILTSGEKFKISDGIVFLNNKPIFSEGDRIYFDDGFLFISRNGFVIRGSNVDEKIYDNITQHPDKLLHVYSWLDASFVQNGVLKVPPHHSSCEFLELPEDVKEIHVPLPNPDVVNGASVSSFRINDLPKSYRREIALVVPKGCAYKYKDHPDFQGYKEIRENTLSQRIVDSSLYVWVGISSFFNYHKWLLPLVVLSILLGCFIVVYLATYQANVNKGNRNKMHSILFSLLFTIFIIPLTFIGVYWFSYIVLKFRNEIISSTIGVAACILAISILSAMGQMTFKGLWKNRRQLFRSVASDIVRVVKKTVKPAVFVLLIVLSVWLYRKYDEKRDDYIDKVYKVYNENGKNYGILKECLSKRSLSKEGPPRNTLKGHGGTVRSVAISRNGKLVVTGSDDNTAMLWDAETGEVIDTLKGHGGGVRSVAISRDGKLIVTGSSDDTAMLWHAETGEVIDTLKGHDSDVTSVAISRDGKLIVTGSWDDTAMLWHAETGEVIDTLKGHGDGVSSVAISRDGKLIVTGSWDDTAMLWRLEDLLLKDEKELFRRARQLYKLSKRK